MSARIRAWRKTMVAAINAGLQQNLFGLRPRQDYWPPPAAIFDFLVDSIHGLAYVRDIGWDELSIHVALWPTAEARRWIVCGNIANRWGYLVGDAVACGWLERREGRYIMGSRCGQFYCRAARKSDVANLTATPHGYRDHGRFIL